MFERSPLPLSDLEVLVVDCQATAASPRGHLIEIGWAHACHGTTQVRASLVALPVGERIPPAVARITGISDHMMHSAVDARVAWRELLASAATLTAHPPPTIIHFARFEGPFLSALSGGVPPLDLVCTHEIARRLLPDLPRRSLRALTGYFGRAVGALRRSADHVQATAFVWGELVALLGGEGVATWRDLHHWLAAPVAPKKRLHRVWPMPRDARLAVPNAPGVYRLLRTSGDVLYVGKAASLHHRVNSYFRHQHGLPERTLEMLSQVRAVSFEVTASTVEAALLECDEIKRQQPPYNIALTLDRRAVWFTTPDLCQRRDRFARLLVGPFPSAEMLDRFAALVRADRVALGGTPWTPDAVTFRAGYARFSGAHEEFSRDDLGPHAKLLRLGTRLWRQGRRDRDDDVEDASGWEGRRPPWTAEDVQASLEWLAVQMALALRRARWLTWMVEATVTWTEPRASSARLIVIANGEVDCRGDLRGEPIPPIPPGHGRSFRSRREAFTLARFDRLRVLTTEIKRLSAVGAPVSVRFGAGPALAGARLAAALSWI